eukprot:TRINITY_DN98905_c0_g1_i1.p1 TRINITY_DN98905_c0_g1~~TRINITY_DN98905_c0_g1_i1.p1  ORF type:complete len:275 (-),score=82.10 TRINITY_DN98905_c0_g1_i1:89-913(-)
MPAGFNVWYPLGKFAMIVAEVEDGSLDDFPEKFAASKEGNSNEEFRILPMGVKKWTKQIDSLEWVPGSSLVPEAKFEVSDLLGNLLKVGSFAEFLEGKIDAAKLWPKAAYVPSASRQPGFPSKGKGKGGSKGGKGGGKKGKGGMKGYGAMGGMSGMPMPMYGGGCGGKGMPMQMPMPMNMSPPNMPNMQPQMQMYNQPPTFQQGSEEMQRQMYGEQLYVLVLPLSPSPYIAQKITGMLLELPTNELLMNLTDPSELSRRVKEALEVLKDDGIAS